MRSILLSLLFLTLVKTENIAEFVKNNSAIVYPTILPNGSVVVASQPTVKQATTTKRCNETEFCFEVIPAAMGAYVKGVMNESVASAVFTGVGNSRGHAVAYISQNASKNAKPSFPNNIHGTSTAKISNGTILVEVYRFNRMAAKIEAFDKMTAVKDLTSKPVLGLYSPLLLPPKQQNYSIVLINLPKDNKNYTLTFSLPEKTKRTYVFQRQNMSGAFLRGSEQIYFEVADIKLSTTVAPFTTSGTNSAYRLGVLSMTLLIFAH